MKFFGDVQLSWQSDARVTSFEVLRDRDRKFLTAESVGTVDGETRVVNDAGAVASASGSLFYYKVRGLNCAGVPGP